MKKQSKKQSKRRRATKAKRQYKDTIFRMLFKDRKRLLELYNAVSGKHYTDAGLLQIVTLENAIYLGIKNDISFLIDFSLYLYEHQATVNPNMPFRFLQYVTAEYNRLRANENFYGSRLVLLPTPHFVVFYNGTDPQPERQTLRLSDAFQIREAIPQLELQVLALNINKGFNAELKAQCRTLKEYMQYVDLVREYATLMPMAEAVDLAVDQCIREDILRDFLLANKAEVKRMSIFEYDEEAVRRTMRRDAYEEGREAGMTAGIAAGKAESIIKLLQKKEELPRQIQDDILAQKDLETLNVWFDAAVAAGSLAEWQQLVNRS